MNQSIFEGIRGDNENFIVLLYDFDLCQNSAHVKLHISKAEQCDLSTRGGEGVKNGQKLVHVVVECPLKGY